MEFVEGLVQLAVYGAVVAAVAMATPRVGSGVMALLRLAGGRKDRMTPAE